jgi:hypothetical protein
MDSACKHGNEPLGSIKCWEVLKQLGRLFKKGSAPCSHVITLEYNGKDVHGVLSKSSKA